MIVFFVRDVWVRRGGGGTAREEASVRRGENGREPLALLVPPFLPRPLFHSQSSNPSFRDAFSLEGALWLCPEGGRKEGGEPLVLGPRREKQSPPPFKRLCQRPPFTQFI